MLASGPTSDYLFFFKPLVHMDWLENTDQLCSIGTTGDLSNFCANFIQLYIYAIS